MRYSVSGTPILIGWSEQNNDEWTTIPAAIKDISLGGARVVAEAPIPDGASVQVCLLGSRYKEKVRARVISHSRIGFPFPALLGRRKYLTRLAFDDACPYEFFKAAIEDFVVETKVVEFISEQFDSRYWR